jgi:hypothetical protein
MSGHKSCLYKILSFRIPKQVYSLVVYVAHSEWKVYILSPAWALLLPYLYFLVPFPIAINTIYNFVVKKVLIWNYLESQNIVLNSLILKFKIFKQPQMFDMDCTKVLVISIVYNFVLVKLFRVPICVLRTYILKFKIYNFQTNLECSYGQYQSCGGRPNLWVYC